MRSVLLIALFSLYPIPVGAVQQGAPCESTLWRSVEEKAAPGTPFGEFVAFLRSQSIHYRVVDARPTVNLVDGELNFDPEPNEASDCLPLEDVPNCTIVVRERLPEDKPTFASLPAIVIAEELTFIDFDANGKLIGARCEILLTGP